MCTVCHVANSDLRMSAQMGKAVTALKRSKFSFRWRTRSRRGRRHDSTVARGTRGLVKTTFRLLVPMNGKTVGVPMNVGTVGEWLLLDRIQDDSHNIPLLQFLASLADEGG